MWSDADEKQLKSLMKLQRPGIVVDGDLLQELRCRKMKSQSTAGQGDDSDDENESSDTHSSAQLAPEVLTLEQRRERKARLLQQDAEWSEDDEDRMALKHVFKQFCAAIDRRIVRNHGAWLRYQDDSEPEVLNVEVLSAEVLNAEVLNAEV